MKIISDVFAILASDMESNLYECMEAIFVVIRAKYAEASKFKNIELFKSGRAPFTKNGINVSKRILENEAVNYTVISRKIFDSIRDDIRNVDMNKANDFVSAIYSSLDQYGMDFRKERLDDVKNYFRFAPQIVKNIIARYVIDGMDKNCIVHTLINFQPVYTEMMLTDLYTLQIRMKQIITMLSPTEKIDVEILELEHYYSQLIHHSFKSEDASNAIAYIRKIINNFGPLKYRVIPDDYVEPPEPVFKPHVKVAKTATQSIANYYMQNLNTSGDVTFGINMSTRNTSNGSGSIMDNSGSGTFNAVTGEQKYSSQNQNTGSGSQCNKNEETKNTASGHGINSRAGKNTQFVAAAIVFAVVVACLFNSEKLSAFVSMFTDSKLK